LVNFPFLWHDIATPRAFIKRTLKPASETRFVVVAIYLLAGAVLSRLNPSLEIEKPMKTNPEQVCIGLGVAFILGRECPHVSGSPGSPVSQLLAVLLMEMPHVIGEMRKQRFR